MPETATIAQVLKLNGYNTAMFGKHHNIPTNERSAAGPFDTRPTGLGFEYFFGFPGGDADQYNPILYRGTSRVDADEIDEVPVTNRDFASFVAATGHVTLAEIAPDPKDYPGLPLELAQPGSLVFEPTAGPVDLSSVCWWDFRLGATWRMPLGLGSSIDGIEDHPVVHVAYADAQAYAHWAGKALPTEAEFEFAARSGPDGVNYAWGDELAPAGAIMANYWQGGFPHANSLADGWLRTSPVRCFPANGYGLYDMIGKVWEWTDDWFAQPRHEKKLLGACCIPANPRGGTRGGSIVKSDPIHIPRKVLKGGSHLCAESYCQRYRPAARYAQPIDTSASRIGFRCVMRCK